jgi:F0F1-type ATP synthase assembly protein I
MERIHSGNDPGRGRANKALQDNLDESEPVFFASYGLIGAIILLGALGYAADRWLNTGPWLVAAGLAAGIVLGFYALVIASRVRH